MTALIEIQNKALAAQQAVAGCGEADAAKAAAIMVGGYANLSVHDVKTFTAHLVTLMAEYPADICAKAARQIPRREKYLNVAAVANFLWTETLGRREALLEAMEAKRKAEEADKERAHREQVQREHREFQAWLKDHPEGTYRQWLGIAPHVTGPFSDYVRGLEP